MFCNLAKDFDCINHKTVLPGIQGATESWFRSYLTDIKQNIKIKSSNLTQNTYSNWVTIKQGVPRGQSYGGGWSAARPGPFTPRKAV
jgi:hypothetical protein